jgi:cytochrome c oxidase subunit I
VNALLTAPAKPAKPSMQPHAKPWRAEDPEKAGVDFSLSAGAMILAVGSLILAGIFSLLLVVGRLPMFSGWFTDPLFFKRGLVVHVNLALIVWFFAFAAGLFALLPGTKRSHQLFRFGLLAAVVGAGGMVAGLLFPSATPVLSNYVPVLDHPVFITGLLFFWGGLVICFLDGRLFRNESWGKKSAEMGASLEAQSFRLPSEVAIGLKVMAAAYLLAMATFAVSWWRTPSSLEAQVYYEFVFWGGGHVLQVANVAAMLSLWLLLLSSLLKKPMVTPRVAGVIFLLLLAPHLAGPWLAWEGTSSLFYRLGFTRLMQFGIFPVVIFVLVICLRQLWGAWIGKRIGKEILQDPRFIGFCASVVLTLAGFILGAMIRNSTTLIPAHYHAAVGAVTVIFMAAAYMLLKTFGLSPGTRALQTLQLYLFGIGQLVFAIGFGWAGLYGLGRKAYGADQHIRSMGEYAGLIVMAAGGLVAVGGGVMFLCLVVRAWQPRALIAMNKLNLKRLIRSDA